MARDIPGFYYDLEKKKYFKIQPNHAVPSAARHTQQAVAARKAVFSERQDDQHKNKRLLLGSIATHKLLKRPDLSFSLNMQLGYSQARPPSSVGDSIARYYGATLSRRELIDATEQTLSLRHFSFDDTGLLFSDRSNSINGFIESTSFGPRPRPDGPLQLDISYWRADLAARVMAMTSADNLIFWATSRYDLGAQCTLAHPHHLAPGYLDFTSINLPQLDVWGLAASPQRRSIAAATTPGVVVFTNIIRHSLDSTTKFPLPETMTVSYKDENVILAGHRSGNVGLCDLRTRQAISKRIRHGSGITGLRALSDANCVLVRGFQGGKMSIYDLRYTPLVKASRTSKQYIEFPAARQPDRFGLGFDYEPTMNVVATAHSDTSQKQNRVSLFSTKTGQAIPSPLGAHNFREPVTCIRFANLRSGLVDGKIDSSIGPKGIVVASGVLDVWSPEGCGIETDEQE